VGHLRAIDCTTDVIERWQLRWQQVGTTAATVNRGCTSLRRAFSQALRARKLPLIPYVPRLAEHGARGRYIAPLDATRLRKALPAGCLRDRLRLLRPQRAADAHAAAVRRLGPRRVTRRRGRTGASATSARRGGTAAPRPSCRDLPPEFARSFRC